VLDEVEELVLDDDELEVLETWSEDVRTGSCRSCWRKMVRT